MDAVVFRRPKRSPACAYFVCFIFIRMVPLVRMIEFKPMGDTYYIPIEVCIELRVTSQAVNDQTGTRTAKALSELEKARNGGTRARRSGSSRNDTTFLCVGRLGRYRSRLIYIACSIQRYNTGWSYANLETSGRGSARDHTVMTA